MAENRREGEGERKGEGTREETAKGINFERKLGAFPLWKRTKSTEKVNRRK